MNPLTNVKNVKKLSEQELTSNFKTSWHDQYRDSAWIFIGGLPYDLTEGDVICIFSQYGEIVNINLVRDKGSGKSKGYCFMCYEDQRSTILAVDNLNGIKVLGRIIRVDHVANYKAPKETQNVTEETRRLHEEGCAPSSQIKVKTEPPDDYPSYNSNYKINKDLIIKREKDIKKEKDIKREKPDRPIKIEKDEKKKEKKKRKKSKEEKKKKKKRRRSRSDSGSESSSSSDSD